VWEVGVSCRWIFENTLALRVAFAVPGYPQQLVGRTFCTMKIGSIRQRSDLEEEESYMESVAKRSKPPDTGKIWDDNDDMRVEMTTNTPATGSAVPSSPDDVLIDMIQSGQYSRTQVVQFCLSAGIPLSRMLRLDLMRLNNRPPPPQP
jgi:hypothetical protein